jgi:hypothetical protein
MCIYGGGIEKAYIIISEVADEMDVVANAMPVKRSVKAIPNNISAFLFIVTEISIVIVLYILKTLKKIGEVRVKNGKISKNIKCSK